ncbi:MAG: uracil-DNA glycosylase [Fimbriimonadaceae bacterium]
MIDFQNLNERIVSCRRCPRLIDWCEKVARDRKPQFAGDDYWGRPVPNFGDPDASVLIVGLAPAAHGANRTGRMFTGDRSGDWLYRSLHRAGLANQPTAEHAEDGLKLNGLLITAVNHCAPPANKPTRQESLNCRTHLLDTLKLNDYRAILCLGSLAWNHLWDVWQVRPRPKFEHGAEVSREGLPTVLASYHPSQQNTFTGRLTQPMLDQMTLRLASLRR